MTEDHVDYYISTHLLSRRSAQRRRGREFAPPWAGEPRTTTDAGTKEEVMMFGQPNPLRCWTWEAVVQRCEASVQRLHFAAVQRGRRLRAQERRAWHV